MTRIGRNPALATIRFTLVVSAGFGLLLGSALSRLGDGVLPYPVAAAGVAAVVFGLMVGITGLRSESLDWDERAGTVTFRRRTVPLASFTQAVRGLSAGANTNFSLSYRFVSTEGPSVRILVAGKPFAGLDPDGIAALRRFVEAAPIANPPIADGLTDAQNALVDELSESGGTSAVGKRVLLAELDTVVAPGGAGPRWGAGLATERGADADDDADHATGSLLSGRERARLERLWREDDADAAAYLADHSVATAPRRALFWLTLLATIASPAAFGSMLILEAVGDLGTDVSDALIVVAAATAVIAVIAFLCWCAAADLQVRRLQSIAAAWLETRTPDERMRGLAAPLLVVWSQPSPGTRLVRAVGVGGAALSGFAVILGLVLLEEPDVLDPGAASAMAAGGAVVLVVSILACMWTTRRRRDGHRQLVRLAGPRLDHR